MTLQDRKKLYSGSLYIIITAFLFTLLSSTAFMHIHVRANGKIVVHSHANRQTSSDEGNHSAPAEHEHSNAEYYFYQATSDFDKFITVITDNNLSYPEKEDIFLFSDYHSKSQNHTHDYFLRAPPTCKFL